VNCKIVTLREKTISIKVGQGESLLDALINNGLYLPAVCGAKGTCGKCKIKLMEGTLEVSPADLRCLSEDEIESGIRLSCTAFPTEDITISIQGDEENDFEALAFFEQEHANTAST
jgi:Na+-transporting NADH:ubiquinone oxidoreductase subunit NqrF